MKTPLEHWNDCRIRTALGIIEEIDVEVDERFKNLIAFKNVKKWLKQLDVEVFK